MIKYVTGDITKQEDAVYFECQDQQQNSLESQPAHTIAKTNHMVTPMNIGEIREEGSASAARINFEGGEEEGNADEVQGQSSKVSSPNGKGLDDKFHSSLTTIKEASTRKTSRQPSNVV